MKAGVAGFVIPTTASLATEEHDRVPIHKQYTYSLDRSAQLLRQRGYRTEHHIRGQLPLGYGFGSSTVLTFLHLRDQLTSVGAVGLAEDCDAEIHGFSPSGLDTASCLHQRPGFYTMGRRVNWESPGLNYTLVMFPQIGGCSLADIERRVSVKRLELAALAATVGDHIRCRGEICYRSLLAYSQVLLGAGVYSPQVQKALEWLGQLGVVAKGIGGLYDKAVIIIWQAQADTALLKTMLAKFGPLTIVTEGGGCDGCCLDGPGI